MAKICRESLSGARFAYAYVRSVIAPHNSFSFWTLRVMTAIRMSENGIPSGGLIACGVTYCDSVIHRFPTRVARLLGEQAGRCTKRTLRARLRAFALLSIIIKKLRSQNKTYNFLSDDWNCSTSSILVERGSASPNNSVEMLYIYKREPCAIFIIFHVIFNLSFPRDTAAN